MVADQWFGVACISLQQQPKRHPSRRDGSGQDHPDHCPDCLPHGEEGKQWSFPHHRPFVVSCSSVLPTHPSLTPPI